MIHTRKIATFVAAALVATSMSSMPAFAAGPEFGDPTNTKSARLQGRLPRPIVDAVGGVGDPNIIIPPEGLVNVGDKRVSHAFDVISDYDARILLGTGTLPPDTMGAVGTTQYVQTINGGYGIFDKKTGQTLGLASRNGFWAALGQTGSGGDPRILFDSTRNRWITLAFGANVKDINIAVSDTDDALGGWKAARFEGLAPAVPGAVTIADYPTLAMDNTAVYIGTNNFDASFGTPANPTPFVGVSLHVFPVADLFAAGGPVLANIKTFNTPFVSGSPANDTTKGFAIQGVNSNESDGTGHVVAASAFINGALAYDILNAGTAGATQGGSTIIDQGYLGNNPGRQPGRPDAVTPGPLRNIDTLDDRIGTNAWELNGKTYLVHTVTPDDGDLSTANDFTRVRVLVIDSTTKDVIQTFDIGEGVTKDFYMGSIAVGEGDGGGGRAVIAYNRSGTDASDGRITFAALRFRIRADGTLAAMDDDDIVLRVSDTAGYLNGNREITGAPGGRQRWGDYSAVNLDPSDPLTFYAIGEYALPAFETAIDGFPVAPSGFSRWGQFVAAVTTPEPGSMGVLFLGLAALGYRARRRLA